MKTLDHKLIIYDSNCKVCSSMKEVITRFTSVPDVKIKAYKDLDSQLNYKVDPDRFKNEMALIDLSGKATLYGAEGVAYIFSSQYKTVDLLLSSRILFKLFAWMYKLQAYNRYIIATPKSNFQCDCFPDKAISYRVAYIGVTVTLSILLTLLFGISLQAFFPDMSSQKAGLEMLLMAGTGWVIQIIAALLFMKGKALDYVGHLGSIMVVGLLLLVPWMLIKWIANINYFYLPLGSVLLSSMTMLYLQVHRTKHLGISQAWTFSWFLFLQLGAAGWIYVFHIK